MQTQEYEELRIEFDNFKTEAKIILDRFKLFKEYSEHDYQCAIGDLRELVG